MTRPGSVTVFTHHDPEETREPLRRLIDAAAGAGVELRFSQAELDKHGIEPGEGRVLATGDTCDGDLAVVFGGDGTILTALRACAAGRVPVFAFNYGAIGFLSTIDREELDSGVERALSGEFEVLPMPALVIERGGERRIGVNDISFHRKANSRVATLGYSVGGDQLGRVRCDGLVAATAVGSTGYNLANGGPVLAWGVQGFVVSFIAPHTLTARSLVVAPADALDVSNESERDPVEITTDGRPAGELGCDEQARVAFEDDQVMLAQVPGTTFYHRFREKFGRLAY